MVALGGGHLRARALVNREGGTRVDAVREFIDARVPGLLVSLTR